MKKLLKGLLVVAMALAVTACGGTDDKAANSDKKQVEINIGVSADYPPYEELQQDGSIEGFDADMIALFPSYLNDDTTEYKFTWNNMSFENVINQVQAGQCQIGVAGFTYDESRKVEWSKPYALTSQVAVVNKDSDIKTLKDLEGKTIAAQSAATGEKAAKTVKDANVVSVTNVQEIFSALTSHQYDAVVVDYAVAKSYVENQGFVMLEDALLDEENFIIAKQGDTETIELINKALEKFLASEDYPKLCDKWGIKPLNK